MHVCFVLPHAYALFDRSSTEVFGGSEVRGWIFGTELSRRSDYRVTFIVSASGAPRIFTCGNACVHTYNPAEYMVRSSSARKVLNVMRRLVGRPDSHGGVSHPVKQAIQQIGADVYCAFGASDFTGMVAGLCREIDRPMVLFTGSEGDFSSSNRRGVTAVNEYGSTGDGAWRAITGARLIVTQSHNQARLLASRFGKSGVTILNPIQLERTDVADSNASTRDYVLWVGKADPIKRPDIVVDLAKRSTDLRFVMVVNPVDRAIWDRLVASKPENVVIYDYLPLARTEALFQRAWALLNTSVYEGFPNTFLQAGKYGVPIVTSGIDPDGFITRTGSGVVCQEDPTSLNRALRRLRDDAGFWRDCSRAVARYVADNHEVVGRVQELDAALLKIVQDEALDGRLKRDQDRRTHNG